MSRNTNESEFRLFLRRNLGILFFLIIAAVGLVTVYRNFSETEELTYSVQVGGEGAVDPNSSGGSAQGESFQAFGDVGQQFAQSPGPLKIGIVVGHRGSDSGAVCDDGLQEVQINEAIAMQVLQQLEAQGLPVSLLSEFDNRINGFSSDLLVSLHSDSCTPLDPSFTGFKTTVNQSPQAPLLQNCIEQNYARQTGLPIHPTTITEDMIHYHVFNNVSNESPALLLEMGFMFNDRELLTNGSGAAAQGITNGILCFLQSQ